MIMGAWGLGRKKGWTNPYITDGLVAMWDGEWNAGGGVHDANANAWKDLIAGLELPVLSGGSWGSNCIIGDGNGPAAGTYDVSDVLKQPFCECVCEVQDYPSRNDANFAFYLKYSGTDDYFKTFGLEDRYGTVYFVENQVVSKTSSDNFLSANTFSIASDAKNSNQSCFINAISRTVAYNSLQGSFGRGVYVGARSIASLPGWNKPVRCKVFSIRFYSRVLSDDEIAANYAIDKQRFNLP